MNDELIAKTPIGEIVVGIKSDHDYPGIFVELRGEHLNDRFKEGAVRLAWVEYSSDKQCLQTIAYGDGNADDFTHLIEHEHMYSSEVAIYKALATELEKVDCLPLPPVMLRFPAWSKDELLQNAKTVHVDSVEFKCEPLAYPPLLQIEAQGSCLRILLDFNHYYDSEDLTALATEAKNEGYSLLKYAMPKLDEDREFTPDRIMTILRNYEKAEWVFSRLEQHWKEKYYAVAVEPQEYGSGYLCPISIGRYKGKYSARWGDCAYCRFNVDEPPACLCVAKAGIQKKEDFKRDLQDRLSDIDKIRRTNEEEILLREERERYFERRSVYTRPTPYAAKHVVPSGPTQEELDAEYIRICQSYDPTSEEWTVDRYKRWQGRCKPGSLCRLFTKWS